MVNNNDGTFNDNRAAKHPETTRLQMVPLWRLYAIEQMRQDSVPYVVSLNSPNVEVSRRAVMKRLRIKMKMKECIFFSTYKKGMLR